MSCQCQRKKLFEYDKVKELATKVAMLEEKTYYIYQKREGEYDFAPIDAPSENRLHAIEFIFPV